MQVAKVISVEEIDSAKLYKCQVDIGNGVNKQVMAGLKQHVAKDDLLHSLVVVITNLKAAKLAGNLSEAMILAAQTPAPDKPQGELVQTLQVPGVVSHPSLSPTARNSTVHVMISTPDIRPLQADSVFSCLI